MWLDEDAPTCKRDLILIKPILNAPGMLGFAPDPHNMPFLGHLGAFITNPISRRPRQPAKNRCCFPFPGGFLLRTGHPNPGISRAIQQNKRAWADAPLPVIVHLLVESPESVAEMVRKLEGLENILAVELRLPPDCDEIHLQHYMESAMGELPVIISLVAGQISKLLAALIERQPAAVHLQPPRGTLLDSAGELVSGRLYGPAMFPSTLLATSIAVEAGLPIIAGCGVFQLKDAQTLLDIGVFAVSAHASLWGINPSAMF